MVQLVSQHQYDNSWTPQVEWANISWQATPDLSLRIGRTALPAYLISESRFVGYSQHWVRAPLEAYAVQSITSNDGLDATWRQSFGSVNNTLQAYVGTSKQKAPGGEAETKPSWGITDTVQMGDLTLRASYGSMKVDMKVPGFNALLGGVSATATSTATPYPSTSAQLRDGLQNLRMQP